MNPSPIAIKRIFNDIKDLNNDPLEKEGIYHYYNEENIMHARIMMIGPEETPYENGFYFFNFTFPNDYPFNPPAVKYETRDGNIRFNPNLYTCGKVCLSLINTWEGPKWTSCQTIRSVLISLRGLVLGTKHPLQNEPGYENCTDGRSENYNRIIEHENYRVAVIKMIENPPKGFEVFVPKMVEYLKMKYPWYNKRLKQLSVFDNTQITSIYGMKITRNFSEQLLQIHKILEKNGMKMMEKVEAKKTPVSSPMNSPGIVNGNLQGSPSGVKGNLQGSPQSPKFSPGKNGKKATLQGTPQMSPDKMKKWFEDNKPDSDPSEFYVGYQMLSKKNNKYYMVQEVVTDGKKKKIWVDSSSPVFIENNEIYLDQNNYTENTKEKEKKRGAPSQSAKDFEVGYTMKSDNDNKNYKVKEVGTENKKFKRWVSAGEEEKEIKVKDIVVKDNQGDVVQQTKEEDTVSNEKGKRKAPTNPASGYNEGHEMKSDNDGKIYVVKSVGKEGKEFKRWVLKK